VLSVLSVSASEASVVLVYDMDLMLVSGSMLLVSSWWSWDSDSMPVLQEGGDILLGAMVNE
jgi:hypothetical protein